MKKRPRDASPQPLPAVTGADGASTRGPALIRHLASCNTRVRSKTLSLLLTWVESQTQPLPEDDIKKLWKGLFYCLWHSDKAPAQHHLITKISSLLLSLHLPVALQYFTHFVLTFRREWNGIDHLRLDKFYLAIRRFMGCVFTLLRKYNWDLELLEKFNGILENAAFFADDKLLGNGVNYHIVAVFLEELKGSGFFPVKEEVIERLFRPFFGVLARSSDKVLVGKVKVCMFDELLKVGNRLLEKRLQGNQEEEQKESYGDIALGWVAMKMGFAGKLYEVGSADSCLQGNRKVVFGLHNEYLKLEKELESAGVDIPPPKYNVVEEDEIPELVPIESGQPEAVPMEEVEHGNLKIKKKKKKAKKGSDEDKRKAKLKKKKEKKGVSANGNLLTDNGVGENGNVVTNADVNEPDSDENGGLTFNESVISNLQMQFEKVAAETGIDEDVTNGFDVPIITMKRTSTTKRKRAKTTDVKEYGVEDVKDQEDHGGDAAAKSADKSAKKVRFAMKNNLVWKPQTPLPPQSLRIPPSVTPRGSALKKGLPPGPIREIPPAKKKLKQKKKVRKILKSRSPAVKRLKKL